VGEAHHVGHDGTVRRHVGTSAALDLVDDVGFAAPHGAQHLVGGVDRAVGVGRDVALLLCGDGDNGARDAPSGGDGRDDVADDAVLRCHR
jgi:hypothetical protein